MLKLLQQGTVAVPFSRTMLLGFAASLLQMQTLLADEVMNVTDIKECRSIVVESERLLCYDTVADGGIYNQQKLEQVQKEKFGSKEELSDSTVEKITVTIVRIQKNATGIHYFHTDDGNVWKHSGRGSWNLKVPFQAEIKAGAMGSFFLVTEGGKSARVKRLR